MKAVEFTYWLQGYFEITGGAPVLTTDQLRQVNAKAKSVQAGTDVSELAARSFADYAQGALSLLPERGEADAGMLRSLSENLRTRLNGLFFHAVDPAAKSDQQNLGDVLRTERKRGGLEAC